MSSDTNIPVMLSPEELVQQVRAIRVRMPKPNLTPPPAALRRRLGHVDANFVNAAVTAAGLSEVVEKSIGRSDEDFREEIETAGRWATAIDELRELLQIAETANKFRRQQIGLAALQTYQICTALVREGQHSHLATQVEELRRLNRFGRGRRKTAPPQPNPVNTAPKP